VVAALTVLLVIALLVGWVVTWALDDEGPNAVWLTLGPIAFSLVLVLLVGLFWSLRRTARLRQTEIAFLTGASHNLRTPLTAIRTGIQTLATTRHLSSEDACLLFKAVTNETHRLELRIDNLIETARLDLEHRPYDLGPLDLVALVREVLDEARWAFAAAGGSFTPPSADEPLMVVGDARALRLLFENLIDNALKYAEGAPRVEVSCAQSADHAVVRVRDHGLGFTSTEAQAIFSGRRQGDTGRRGSGLGLRLARAIARGHGGEVRLDSAGPHQGATAEVWLPLDEAE
jgi:signal transduction histidine kinase